MYLAPLKTLLVEAMKKTLDSDYIEPDFRNKLISIEFPVKEQDYPSVWVDYSPASLKRAGVDHREFDVSTGGNFRGHTRWRYAGSAIFTVLAMTSLERDRFYDELVRIMAFGEETPQTSEFRSYIEANEFIGCNFSFDHIESSHIASSPGTPWGTDDMIYEATIEMACIGEFVADHATQTLIPLTAIEVNPYNDQEPDPLPDETDNPWI